MLVNSRSLFRNFASTVAKKKNTSRTIHSLLFCPGNKQRVLNKAIGLGADAVVADFEDAVAPSEKINARTITAEALRKRPRSETIVAVRINEPSTRDGILDLEFLIEDYKKSQDKLFCCDALVIPKCENVDSIMRVVDQTEGLLPIWCMVETSKGVLNVASIASVHKVAGLILGANDLSKCMQARQTPNREPLFYAMSSCVTAARAFEKFVVDSVHINIHDDKGFRASCIQARDFGFDGKSLIHPGQASIELILVLDTPTFIYFLTRIPCFLYIVS